MTYTKTNHNPNYKSGPNKSYKPKNKDIVFGINTNCVPRRYRTRTSWTPEEERWIVRQEQLEAKK